MGAARASLVAHQHELDKTLPLDLLDTHLRTHAPQQKNLLDHLVGAGEQRTCAPSLTITSAVAGRPPGEVEPPRDDLSVTALPQIEV
jgi:hypothetical protein